MKKWHHRHRPLDWIRLILLNLFFLVLCFIVVVPILYAVNISFSGAADSLSTATFFPSQFTFENYRKILFDYPFFTWLGNTVLLALGTTLFTLIPAVFGAYAFASKRFHGRKFMLYVLLVLNAFPAVLTMFALFRLFKDWHLLNSFWGLIVIYSGSLTIFSIWNMKGYFESIPSPIQEAAKIDGANEAQVLFQIVLPLARPAIIVTSILVLISVWNEYIFATTFLTGEGSYTLAAGLYTLQHNDYTRLWPLFAAGSILISLPILIIFYAMQRYMVSGLTAGGVKE